MMLEPHGRRRQLQRGSGVEEHSRWVLSVRIHIAVSSRKKDILSDSHEPAIGWGVLSTVLNHGILG